MPVITDDLLYTGDPATGALTSLRLYGHELLGPTATEVHVNGLPLQTRVHPPFEARDGHVTRMKGEHFVNHLAGNGLVITREMGSRPQLPHRCLGIQYWVRREIADLTYPIPGPGGPVVESPLWVDTLSLLTLNWQFWGDATRMIFPSSYSAGPCDAWGHIGYENDTPENAKAFLDNVYRRVYAGGLVIHGGVFYNADTAHWLALTCRRPHQGYILNMHNAGRGVGYDFTFHAHMNLGDHLRMPEIKLYYGETYDEMQHFMADYCTHYYQQTPDWTYKTLWGPGIAWNNEASWDEQGEKWERDLAEHAYNGLWINLVTDRPIWCGTSPSSYEPDPNHGTLDDFRRACRRVTDQGIPLVTWMSHSGLLPGAPDVDDDWFIRGIDGRLVASWGNGDSGMMYVNPGHPGYIEYTKRWIRFYINECGAKGIFFDCLGFPMPPDFAPRTFMRYPGDTGVMAIRFLDEMARWIKACDPEAVLIGEGATLDAPVEMYSIITNPRRGVDGFGPRDYLLNLNHYAKKPMTIYHDIAFFPGSGFSLAAGKGWERHDAYMRDLLAQRGGPGVFTPLPGDLSVLDDLLFVPFELHRGAEHRLPRVELPPLWRAVCELTEEITGAHIRREADGAFLDVAPGIYRMR
jgi:hypothetical protein